MGTGDPETSERGPRRLGVVATVVALVLVAIYLVFVALQWGHTNAIEMTWSRREELLTGLQALALTAIGALLGTTVQRQVTRQVEDRASRAESLASRNAKDAEKGRALQRSIETRRLGPAVDEHDVARGTSGDRRRDELAELAELARSYDQEGT